MAWCAPSLCFAKPAWKKAWNRASYASAAYVGVWCGDALLAFLFFEAALGRPPPCAHVTLKRGAPRPAQHISRLRGRGTGEGATCHLGRHLSSVAPVLLGYAKTVLSRALLHLTRGWLTSWCCKPLGEPLGRTRGQISGQTLRAAFLGNTKRFAPGFAQIFCRAVCLTIWPEGQPKNIARNVT